MVDTYVLLIDRNLDNSEFNSLLSCVSDDKRDRINSFYRFEDKQRSLLGDILTRYSICKRLGIRNDNIVFGINEYGKPDLLGPDDIHFNISHSEDLVVCAVDSKLVGVDVELIKPIDFEIAERFFSRDEYISLLSKKDELRLKYFYTLWTLKESYIKAEGSGLSIPLDSFTIIEENKRITIQTISEIKNLFFKKYELYNTYIFAICAYNNEFSDRICFNVNQFCKEIAVYL